MDRDPVRTAIRLLRKRNPDRTGVCARCGLKGPVELHHVSCRNHDPVLVIPLCHDCHVDLTEGQLRERVNMRFESNRILRVANALEAQAAFHEDFARSQRRLAELLRGEVK